MQSAFADFLFDPFEDGVKGMLKSFLDAIRRMIAEAAAAKFFESDGVTAFIKAISGRASGGPVTAGTPYIVGEAGPELFMPGSSGMIIPNHKLGGGGGAVNNYYFEAGADVATIRAEIIPMLERTKDSAVQEVFSYKSRGLL